MELKIYFLFFVLSISVRAFCQSDHETRKEKFLREWNERIQEQDHLEPIDSYFDFFAYEEDYYRCIDSLLIRKLSDKPIIRMIVLPSFKPEYVLSIDVQNEKYIFTYISSNKSIWETDNLEQIKIDSQQVELSCDLSENLKFLYELIIQKTKYPNGWSSGSDGTNYYFSTYGKYGRRSGTKWSPREGTRIKELVRLTELLKNFLQTSSDKYELEMDLNNSINQLIKRI